MLKVRELADEELEAVTGGSRLTRKEIADCINTEWTTIPGSVRSSIIEKYTKSGSAATYRLIKDYIEKFHMDDLTLMLDMFK